MLAEVRKNEILAEKRSRSFISGLLLQLLLVLTDELESKIYAFGARNDENIQDIQAKNKALGAVEKRKINFCFLFILKIKFRC
jgi:hypothetical protein